MTLNFPELEKKILKFWIKNRIFEKSLEKTKGSKRFVFYEGPPFANGLPGIHHLLARALKDIILRYKTMQGFYVERKAGWDTHGLPTEMAAEKKLEIKSKKEIEKIGIEKFIQECKRNVFTYKKEWEEFTERIGFWLDLKNAYITCDNDYIESLWWILKQIWNKGFLYQDYKVVPYCPRCGTSLSSHEVAQGYETIKENSIYVKFPVKKQKNTYFLVWTTTPWTLPGNLALAINRNINYVKVKEGDEFLILAENRLGVLKGEYTVVERAMGRDFSKLTGTVGHIGAYEQILPYLVPDPKKSFIVVFADFVSDQDGTGIVHIAPAYGEDDMNLANELGLEKHLIYLNKEGKFEKGFPWSGKFAKDADNDIIQELKEHNLFYKEEFYEHEYPFCWRCETPLLYFAKSSWFIKTTAIKKEMIENNKKINWVPDYLKDGRFGEWLREVKDWNLSRERYWGTPLPIWECEKCKKKICIESREGLKKLQIKNYNLEDLHRPYIDQVLLKCECGGIMKRAPEVIDCWFDSGAMPFAQWHYPFENKNKIDKGEFFPADFIAEGIDQTRGWFYTLLAVSTLLGLKAPYKNVISHGIVLDAKGQKMSKSKGNVISPKDVIDKFGADCSRFYFYTLNQVAEPKRFDFKDVQKLYSKFFNTLWQVYNFFSIYKDKNFKPKEKFQAKNPLDKWIFSRLENLTRQITQNLDKYDVVSAARLLDEFIDGLSRWYLRCSRRRFQREEIKEIKQEATQTLYDVLLRLTKLIAPFTPFIAEQIYQKLQRKEISVHLSQWPKVDKKRINKDLEKKMSKVRNIVSLVLAERTALRIKVRQPLEELRIKNLELKNEKELLDLIKNEVNVKKIIFNKKLKKEIELDTKISEKLQKEGQTREFIRHAKDLRKKIGLTPGIVAISISTTASDLAVEKLSKELGVKEIKIVKDEKEMDADIKKEIELKKGKKDYIGIKK